MSNLCQLHGEPILYVAIPEDLEIIPFFVFCSSCQNRHFFNKVIRIEKYHQQLELRKMHHVLAQQREIHKQKDILRTIDQKIFNELFFHSNRVSTIQKAIFRSEDTLEALDKLSSEAQWDTIRIIKKIQEERGFQVGLSIRDFIDEQIVRNENQNIFLKGKKEELISPL